MKAPGPDSEEVISGVVTPDRCGGWDFHEGQIKIVDKGRSDPSRGCREQITHQQSCFLLYVYIIHLSMKDPISLTTYRTFKCLFQMYFKKISKFLSRNISPQQANTSLNKLI